jgi:hypothetical protein
MPQASKDSEKINRPLHINLLSDFFNVSYEKISDLKKGKVRPTYNPKGIRNVIFSLNENKEIDFKLNRIKKFDFIVNDDIFVEVKQSGDIFFETLSLDKSPNEEIPIFEKLCFEKGLDPIVVNNNAVEKFINNYSSSYIEKFLDDSDFKRYPDFMLLVSKRKIFTFLEFLEEYEIYAEARTRTSLPYKRVVFAFREKGE